MLHDIFYFPLNVITFIILFIYLFKVEISVCKSSIRQPLMLGQLRLIVLGNVCSCM